MHTEDKPIAEDEELKAAASEFLAAGLKYREFLKRKRRSRLAGSVWVHADDGSMVLYTELQSHAMELVRAIHDLEEQKHAD